ncbi:MAG: transporter [Elusimicrobiales bacterium]|nr:transporter [Elusimicrobiales bacterium]
MRFFLKTAAKLCRAIPAALACAALLLPAAVAEDWEFSSTVNYDTGRYGSKDRVESVYIPLTLKLKYYDADFAVTAPYLRQTSRGQVTRVGGKPVRVNTGNSGGENIAESGPGDMLLSAAYTLKLDGPRSFDLALAGRLKLPTASKSKGLGTGEMDEGAGLEFAKEVTPGLTLLSDGYFTIIGDPDGVDFNNEVMLDVGFYSPLSKSIGLTVLYETRSAILDGNADPRSVSGTFSYSMPGGAQFAGGITLGMSDGSPDLGAGAGFISRF